MITQITEANKSAYNDNFRLLNAQIAAKGQSFRVETLNDLFGHLGTIINVWGIDTKYIMLPADEPLFEIDANTRVISIPEHFRKNGISVQGDDLAETVYFKIYRYFDKNDFFTHSKIEVNWKISSGSKTVEGVTLVEDKTDELVPDYIVFAWPIDSNITIGKGTLQFSVTITGFAPGTTDTVGFIYNTLPATVGINGGLVLDNPQEISGLKDRIKRRFINSAYTPENATPLHNLTFEQNLDSFAYYNINKGVEPWEEEDEIVLSVIPQSDETLTSFDYSWAYKKQGDISSSIISTTANQFIVNSDTGYTGEYGVTVQGKKNLGTQEEPKYQTTQPLSSVLCIVPEAVGPQIILSAESVNFTPNEDYIPGQYVYIDDNYPTVQAELKFGNDNEPGRIYLTGKIGEINSHIFDELEDEEHPENRLEQAGTYEWFVDEDEEITAKQTKSLTIVLNQGESVGENTYQAIAINNRNHTYTISEPSNILSFSYIADQDKFTNNGGSIELTGSPQIGPNQFAYGASTKTLNVQVNLSLGTFYSSLNDVSIDCYWEKLINDNWAQIAKTKFNQYNNTNYIFNLNSDANGSFRAIIVLNYHGTKAEIGSKQFEILYT